MILPLQASIGPALHHNDPEKKGVDSLTGQEAMGYQQKNPRLKPWGLTCPSFQGIPKFVPEEWKMEENRQSGVSRREVWTWLNLKSSYYLFMSSLQIMCSTVNQRCALNVSPPNPYLHASRSQGTWKAFIFHRMGDRRRQMGKCNCAMAEGGGQWSMIRQGFLPDIPHLKLTVSERCLSWNADEIWQTQTSPVISPLCLSDCHQRLSEKPSLRSMANFQRQKFFLGFMMHSSLESDLFTAYEVWNQLLPSTIIPFMIFALSSCILLVLPI